MMYLFASNVLRVVETSKVQMYYVCYLSQKLFPCLHCFVNVIKFFQKTKQGHFLPVVNVHVIFENKKKSSLDKNSDVIEDDHHMKTSQVFKLARQIFPTVTRFPIKADSP